MCLTNSAPHQSWSGWLLTRPLKRNKCQSPQPLSPVFQAVRGFYAITKIGTVMLVVNKLEITSSDGATELVGHSWPAAEPSGKVEKGFGFLLHWQHKWDKRSRLDKNGWKCQDHLSRAQNEIFHFGFQPMYFQTRSRHMEKSLQVDISFAKLAGNEQNNPKHCFTLD